MSRVSGANYRASEGAERAGGSGAHGGARLIQEREQGSEGEGQQSADGAHRQRGVCVGDLYRMISYHTICSFNVSRSHHPSPVEFNRPERTRLFTGLVRPEERLQAEVFRDRHRAEEGRVQQAGDTTAEGTVFI